MIRRVRIRGFKRFDEVEFKLPGHIVLAGPNNTGKTTVLQAIAAWGLALDRFKSQNDFQRHGGAYTKVPIARQAFSAVPLRSFELLWRERRYRGTIEILLQTDAWTIPMQLIADSTEQVYVRPSGAVESGTVREADLPTVFVPPMTGLAVGEPTSRRLKSRDTVSSGSAGIAKRSRATCATLPKAGRACRSGRSSSSGGRSAAAGRAAR